MITPREFFLEPDCKASIEDRPCRGVSRNGRGCRAVISIGNFRRSGVANPGPGLDREADGWCAGKRGLARPHGRR